MILSCAAFCVGLDIVCPCLRSPMKVVLVDKGTYLSKSTLSVKRYLHPCVCLVLFLLEGTMNLSSVHKCFAWQRVSTLFYFSFVVFIDKYMKWSSVKRYFSEGSYIVIFVLWIFYFLKVCLHVCVCVSECV